MKLLVGLSIFLATVTGTHTVLAAHPLKADTVTNPSGLLGQDFNPITTAVPFLSITPDARHAALGDAGVASSPDQNAAYWNPAKVVFNDRANGGGTLSYTPWLGKIINDMWIFYGSGYYKISREQAVALSFKYFDLGEIQFNKGPDPTDLLGRYNPREFSIDLTYSRMLAEGLGVGLTGRYIHSNLTGAFSVSGGTDVRPANSVATDIGLYYNKELKNAKSSNLALGASISNIGAKLTYSDNSNKDFLPTNLRLGGAFTTNLDPFNTLTFLLDFNKLMVPSPPLRDASGAIVSGKNPDRPLISGMFGSFSDAPNGFKEEIQETTTSMGLEYWYNELFAARLGYFYEAQNKGNRKYMTMGVGFKKNRFGIDVAYLVPTNKREHPLAETMRFTLLFQIEKPATEETVKE